MNKYYIEHEIDTLLKNFFIKNGKATTKFFIDGIEFSQKYFSYGKGPYGEKWISKCSVCSNNYSEALDKYFQKINKIIPKISFIGQAFINYTRGNILVKRKDLGIFFYRFKVDSVGLYFGNSEQIILNELKNKKVPDEFFYYWYDMINTSGYTGKLMLITSAIESLIPEGTNKKNFREQLLGKDLSDKLFTQNEGVRHKITHGEYFSKNDSSIDYLNEIYKKILVYFNKFILTEEKLNLDIKNPQRHPEKSIYGSGSFVKKIGNKELNLNNLLKGIKNHKFKSNDYFEYISGIENF